MKKNLVLYARDTLKQFVKIMDKVLLQIWLEHKPKSINHPLYPKSDNMKSIAEGLLSHIMEHNSRPAKRLRASLVYYAYKLIAGNIISQDMESALLKAASSIELIHTALLIHDDFQDQDSIRRGLPTTHKFYEEYHAANLDTGSKEHFGASMAINAGDYALTIGYQLLLQSGFDADSTIKAMNIMFDGIGQTVYGQSYDVILESKFIAQESDIYDLHHAKTGIYTYLTPLLVGVSLAGGDIKIMNKLIDYAIPCGIAFQLQDDVIGLFGDELKTGKSAYSDIKEGKKTLLMLKTLELASNHEKEILQQLWGKHDLTLDQAEYVRGVVKGCGALEYSYNKAREYSELAQQSITTMRSEFLNLNSEVLDYLEGIAEYMAVKRDV